MELYRADSARDALQYAQRLARRAAELSRARRAAAAHLHRRAAARREQPRPQRVVAPARRRQRATTPRSGASRRSPALIASRRPAGSTRWIERVGRVEMKTGCDVMRWFAAPSRVKTRGRLP